MGHRHTQTQALQLFYTLRQALHHLLKDNVPVEIRTSGQSQVIDLLGILW